MWLFSRASTQDTTNRTRYIHDKTKTKAKGKEGTKPGKTRQKQKQNMNVNIDQNHDLGLRRKMIRVNLFLRKVRKG